MPQFNQYNPFFPGSMPQPDKKPEMKGVQFVAWMFFFASFVASSVVSLVSPTMMAFVALATGIVRKGGMPKFNMEYAQSILLDENTQMLAFLAVASSSGPLSLICWGPILIHGAMVCAWTANDLTHVSGLFVTIVNAVKKLGFLRKVSDNQSKLW